MMGTASAFGEEVVVAAVKARQLGLPNIFYYVAHVDYIQYIGGLKPIGEGVILLCLQLQQLLAG